MSRRTKLAAAVLITCAVMAFGLGRSSGTAAGVDRPQRITHVVVLFQENHSFNDLLGKLCVEEQNRCDGTTTAVISDGTRIPLGSERDIVPWMGHLYADQVAAMNHGDMNGWDHVRGCGPPHYHCLVQANAKRVPTLWSLADNYAMSDRTFATDVAASWGSHIDLVAGTMDGFQGDPYQNVELTGKGNACDGESDAPWFDSDTDHTIMVPACIPDRDGNGPYRPSPVKYVPTIMDSMEAAGLPWNIYAPGKGTGYGWAICPTFFECFSTQRDHVRKPGDFVQDAAHGTLPALSIVVPLPEASQHNTNSLMAGDDWIAKSVAAVMSNKQQWRSTAIFITYDDCGCFYDPVKPPPGFGIREPMVIVSPYARPGYVDHTDASFASILAFTEHAFGLPPLPGGADGTAYDYSDAFNFSGPPLPPIRLSQHPVPASSLRWLADHPPIGDDPT